MNRTASMLAAATLALGLALVGVPLSTDGGITTQGVGSTGCCKQ